MRTDIAARKAEILQWIDEGRSKAFICRQLKCKPDTLERWLDRLNIDYKGNQGSKGRTAPNRKSALDYLSSPDPKSSVLKQKLFEDALKDQRCEQCGISEWHGVAAPLELHHKDFDHFNNSLSNLQILCPNCHTLEHSQKSML